MNILIIGSGGREHCFAWKIKQSPLCQNLFIAPGNAGTATLGTNLNIGVADFTTLAAAALEHHIELIVVGPEEPLVKGIVDFFAAHKSTKHIKVIGPNAAASQLEGSKAYAKSFMSRYNIPTAAFKEFTKENIAEGINYLQNHSYPVVLKADGLAAGKGVLICQSFIEAQAELDLILLGSKFGDAGNKVVVEDFLQGIEMSVFVLTDGKNYVVLPEAKDYKRIGEGDTGLNTGGMGAVSPVPFLNKTLQQKIVEKIINPTINGFKADNLNYIGFVFIGLMIDGNEPYVIEYNCRMGDPETEVVLPRLQNDFVSLLQATANQTLDTITVQADDRAAVAMVAVSGGYPGDIEKGKIITGLATYDLPESILFHSGTLQNGDAVITNGGRVLVAVSYGENITEAAEQSHYLLQQIHFDGINYRRDIGYEFK